MKKLGEFKLSRSGWDLHQGFRLPRANWPEQPDRQQITKAQYDAERSRAGYDEYHRARKRALAPEPTAKEGMTTMRGMNRLANLAQTIMDEIDREADSVADELVAAKTEAKQTIGHFREHAGQIRKVASNVKAQLGQISNIPPTEGSGS